VSDYPTQRLPIQPGDDNGGYRGFFDDQDGQPRRRSRRGRRGVIIFLVTLVVLLGLFVIADRVAVRYADNQFASQVQTQGGLSNKPTVSIEGFPFLTQLAARKFNEVQRSAATEKAGPVVIDNLQATMHGMQLINGFSSARVQSLNGTGLITYASVAKAADVPGLKISQLNSSEAKVTIDLGFISGSGVAKITKAGANKINISVVSAGGIPLSALGGLNNMTITIPGLPMGINLQSITMTQQGILVHITGQNVTLSGG
jgi:predicted flap endonuclease-1-like 5' DNA nuclease